VQPENANVAKGSQAGKPRLRARARFLPSFRANAPRAGFGPRRPARRV